MTCLGAEEFALSKPSPHEQIIMHINRILKRIIMLVRNPWVEMKRIYFRLCHARSKPHDIQCNLDGFSLKLRSNSVLAEPLFVGRGFEEGEVKLLSRLAKPGFKVFDIGANIGLYTVMLAKGVGSAGHVYSFEPYSQVAAYLLENIESNGLTNVTLVKKGVSDTVGTAEFHVFPEGFDVYNSLGAKHREIEEISGLKTYEIPIITLDDFAREVGCETANIIKIDIEGAEERALRGGEQLIKNSPTVAIVTELYEPSAKQCGCSVSGLIKMLEEWGFCMYTIDRFGNDRPVNHNDFNGTYALFRRA